MNKEPRDVFERRRTLLENERTKGGWWDHWKELSDYILPRYGRFLLTESEANQGGKKGDKIVDGNATYGARVAASGMQSGLSSPARPWFRLTLADKDLADYGPVRWWLDNAQNLLYYIFAKSNVYQVLQEFYLETVVFGTSAFGVFKDFDSVIRCRPFTVGEYSLAQGGDLRVNSLYRTFNMTTDQMVKTYGLDNVSSAVKQAYESGKTESWWPMVWLVEPNDKRVKGKLDNKNMEYRSVHYEQKGEHGKIARQSGFKEFPVIVGRWNTVGTNVYGDSPAMDALADIKMLQKERSQLIMGIEESINPAQLAPESMRGKFINGMPGGITYYDENDAAPFRRLKEIDIDIRSLGEEVRNTRNDVDRYFYVDLFKMFTSIQGQPITATEVAERHEEKLLMVGPVIERMESETFDHLIGRTFNIANENGLIPPAPPEAQGLELEIEYVGILAQAQRMVRTASLRETVQFAGELSQIKPDVLDRLDADEALEQFADMQGAPSKIIVPREKADEVRAARAQQQAQMEQAEQGMQAAQGAKMLADADLDKNSALKALVGSYN